MTATPADGSAVERTSSTGRPLVAFFSCSTSRFRGKKSRGDDTLALLCLSRLVTASDVDTMPLPLFIAPNGVLRVVRGSNQKGKRGRKEPLGRRGLSFGLEKRRPPRSFRVYLPCDIRPAQRARTGCGSRDLASPRPGAPAPIGAAPGCHRMAFHQGIIRLPGRTPPDGLAERF